MSPRISDDDLDAIQAKARPKGTLPYLPSERDDSAALASWLTLAMRPADGWRVAGFERTGRDPMDPCTLHLLNGRESRSYRFGHQRDLAASPRLVASAASDGWLAVPHLTAGEVEDLWVAFCTFGGVLTEHDEADEARKWVEQLLRATLPVAGHTLVPDGRHEALMALKRAGEFTKLDAMAMLRPSTNGEHDHYQQRPVRFIDAQTGEQWVRVGEAATFVRWVVGVEPLSHATLRARLSEIGVVGRMFEDHRPPHPKLSLYQLTEELIEGVGGKK